MRRPPGILGDQAAAAARPRSRAPHLPVKVPDRRARGDGAVHDVGVPGRPPGGGEEVGTGIRGAGRANGPCPAAPAASPPPLTSLVAIALCPSKASPAPPSPPTHFIRKYAASIPPYDPPKAMTGASSAPSSALSSVSRSA
jgi:hypothetical protein